MNTLSIVLSIIGGVSTLLSIVVVVTNFRSGVKKEGASSGTLLSDIGYIKAGVDDLKREQKEISEKYYKLSERVTAVEASAKQAHHRIDRIENNESRD